ncbi:MAG: NAD(+) kinase, partial [Campylobacter sp.]|nr:NAD(+) kinase [Campylobacter sp.]
MKTALNLNSKKIKSVGLIAKINKNLASNFKILSRILSNYGVKILLESGCANELILSGYELMYLAKNCD